MHKLHRKTIRLQTHDYKEGLYYVTICTKDREYFFGDIKKGEMTLSMIGKTVEEIWNQIPNQFLHTSLDNFIIMPNHIHGIIQIKRRDVHSWRPLESKHIKSQRPLGSQRLRSVHNVDRKGGVTGKKNQMGSGSLSQIVRWFKGRVTFELNRSVRDAMNGRPYVLFQSRFYDHVVRDEDDLNRIREYILNNPLNWELDDFYQ